MTSPATNPGTVASGAAPLLDYRCNSCGRTFSGDAPFIRLGRHRAHQLAGGEDVSDEDVRKMQAYFARHTVDKDADGFTRGGDGFPSPGRVAWDAWGGDAGERWVGTIDLG